MDLKKNEAKEIKQAIDEGRERAKQPTVIRRQIVEEPKVQKTILPQQNQTIATTPRSEIIEIKKPSTVENTNIYSEKLEKFIEFALADGELTEKEKQILFKKAESEGIDLDEFEMVLDAKLHEKIKKSPVAPQFIAAPKSEKFSDVKKCPACGGISQSFSTRCSDCGHDFMGLDANLSVKKLFELLNEIESKRKQVDSSLSSFFSGPLKGFGVVTDKINNQKKELISSFPIPNTKEDIIEFLSLALPKSIKLGKNSGIVGLDRLTDPNGINEQHNEFVPVWKTKCHQIILKARFTMKEDPKSLEEINYYAAQLGIK